MDKFVNVGSQIPQTILEVEGEVY